MYRLSIWLVALALVFNGVAPFAWSGHPQAQAAFAQDHRDEVSLADCDVHSDRAAAVAAQPGQTHGHTHNHLRCCGTCNVVSLVPDVAVIPVAFSDRAASFYMTQRALAGHVVGLDPGIPKSIV